MKAVRDFMSRAPAGFSIEKLRRVELLVAAGLTLFLAALHILLLFNRGPLWRDEISSLALATQPTWLHFWKGLALDPCPPSFFILLRGWTAVLGESDLALRTLGCLIGLAVLGGFWLNARLLKRPTPLFTLLLLGACPTLIIWGDSLRAYGLGVFWATLCFTFFWRVVAQPSRLSTAGALGASVLSVHSLYIDSFVVLACALAAALIAARRRLWSRAALVVGIGAAAALSLVPYVPLFRATSEWASLLRVDFPFGESFSMLAYALLGPRHLGLWIWILLTGVALVASVWPPRAKTASLDASARPQGVVASDLFHYALLAALIAFGATMVGFRLVGWGTTVWYYLPLLTVAALATDTILNAGHPSKAGPLLRVAVAVIVISVSAPLLFKMTEIRASNVDRIAQLLAKHATPADLVVVWPSAEGITYQRYADQRLSWITVPQAPNLPAKPGDDFLKPFREANSINPILERVEETLRNGGRVWVASSWPLERPSGKLRPIQPFDSQHPHPIGYYLCGWGYFLAETLHARATGVHGVGMPEDQPISIYEHSHLSVFSGWKETARN